jgi:hypothetical protein
LAAAPEDVAQREHQLEKRVPSERIEAVELLNEDAELVALVQILAVKVGVEDLAGLHVPPFVAGLHDEAHADALAHHALLGLEVPVEGLHCLIAQCAAMLMDASLEERERLLEAVWLVVGVNLA